jgi:hypothetical protein
MVTPSPPPPPTPSPLPSRLLWSLLLPATARLGFLRLHRLLSNMAFKACLAVPCARAFTALFQFKLIASNPQPSLHLPRFPPAFHAPLQATPSPTTAASPSQPQYSAHGSSLASTATSPPATKIPSRKHSAIVALPLLQRVGCCCRGTRLPPRQVRVASARCFIAPGKSLYRGSHCTGGNHCAGVIMTWNIVSGGCVANRHG